MQCFQQFVWFAHAPLHKRLSSNNGNGSESGLKYPVDYKRTDKFCFSTKTCCKFHKIVTFASGY